MFKFFLIAGIGDKFCLFEYFFGMADSLEIIFSCFDHGFEQVFFRTLAKSPGMHDYLTFSVGNRFLPRLPISNLKKTAVSRPKVEKIRETERLK